jgi:hypothetical protein
MTGLPLPLTGNGLLACAMAAAIISSTSGRAIVAADSILIKPRLQPNETSHVTTLPEPLRILGPEVVLFSLRFGSLCSGAATSLTSERSSSKTEDPQIKQNQIGLEGTQS